MIQLSPRCTCKGFCGRAEAGADGERGRATRAKELVLAVHPGGQAEGGAGDAGTGREVVEVIDKLGREGDANLRHGHFGLTGRQR